VIITPTVQYYEWNVTGFVQQQRGAGTNLVSLAVAMDATNNNPDNFNAREAASNPPQLVLTIDPVNDEPPTVATPAAASPSPVTGTTTALSVLGADDDGEAGLTYTWSAGTPPAPVSFSANGTNAAKDTTATFTKAGAYAFAVTIREGNGLTATSAVTVTVNQTLTVVTVSPATTSVFTGNTAQFTATAKDQFGALSTPPPSFLWSVSGGGTISPTGLFTAGATAGGPFTVTAASGSVSGTAAVTVVTQAAVTLSPIADSYVRSGAANVNTNFGKEIDLYVKKQTSTTVNDRITFLKFDLTNVIGTVATARLRLNGKHDATTAATLISAFAVANNTWTETGITWTNRPALGAKQGGSVAVNNTVKYYEWDVTAFVKQQKTGGINLVSLGVSMDATDNSPDIFNAREAAANRPELVITTGQ
jgi:hypothetical protein